MLRLAEEWSIAVYFECGVGDSVLWDFIGLNSSFTTRKVSSNIEMQVQDPLLSFYRQHIEQHLFLQQRMLCQEWDGSVTFI